MTPTLLILGGTSEAGALADLVARQGIRAVFSYAGRVGTPKAQPVTMRIGGFGGVAGLAGYLRANAITHVVDATHPFAAVISRNALLACNRVGVPLAALTRPAWVAGRGDRWHRVGDIGAAVDALAGAPKRVFLALGRLHLAQFARQPQHRYLARLVDRPADRPLPDCHIVVARGPFDVPGDTALLQRHRTQVIVCKNSGGAGARAKLIAARNLRLPVLMIARPPLPKRRELTSPQQVLHWLAHSGTHRGV